MSTGYEYDYIDRYDAGESAYEARLDSCIEDAKMADHEAWERAHPLQVRIRRQRRALRIWALKVEVFVRDLFRLPVSDGMRECLDEVPF